MHLQNMKTCEQQMNERKTESQRCVCVCLKCTQHSKASHQEHWKLVSVPVKCWCEQDQRGLLYSLDYAPNQITCLFIRSLLLHQKSSHASFIRPVFLRGPPNNIHNKPSGLRFPPKGRLLDLNFSFLVDSKSSRTVACSNCFPHALGIFSCSEAAIDLFRAGGIIITPQVEGAELHFPLCYTCVIGVWLS